MAQELSQHALCSDSAEIMRRLDRGERFVVTRNGVPVGELTPLHSRRFVATATAIATFRAAPPVHRRRFRAAIDALADPSSTPRA